MNILVFYQYFGTPKGKWSTRIYELTRRWVKEGHRVTVVTSPYDKSDIEATRRIEKQHIEGVDLIVINYPDSNRFSKSKRILNFLVFSLISVYYALTIKTDVVVASSGPITVGIPALAAKILRGKKYIFEVRDLWPQGAVALKILTNSLFIKLAFFFEKVCYKNAAYIVGCSKGMTDDINMRFPHLKTKVIPNASDNDLFDNMEAKSDYQSDYPIFIYTGSLGVMDDVDLVIEAVINLKERNITNYRVEIIGDGVERLNLEQKVKSNTLDNVSFTGLLPKSEVVSRLKSARAAFVSFKPIKILNTVSPNKMFDAFAAGIPIIQNTDGWIKEYVEDQQCGINVSPTKAESMGDAIYKFMVDDAFYSSCAKNAKLAAQTDFNRDHLSDAYIKILKEVVYV